MSRRDVTMSKETDNKKLVGTYWYNKISDDEYELYRHIDYVYGDKPVYENVETHEVSLGIPETCIELVPIMTLAIDKVMGDYYFVLRHDNGKVVRAYNAWSIKRPIHIKKEIKAIEAKDNYVFALYVNDDVTTLKRLGISNDVVAYNILSLFHIETGIVETQHCNLITDKYEAEQFIEEFERQFDIELLGYKLFDYDFSINLSKIVQEYQVIVDKDDHFYLITYTSKSRDLDPDNNEDDKNLKGIADFMDELAKR